MNGGDPKCGVPHSYAGDTEDFKRTPLNQPAQQVGALKSKLGGHSVWTRLWSVASRKQSREITEIDNTAPGPLL